MTKPRMREHLLKVREDVIIHVVNQLLADKGYDAMTVDEVAANAGLSKASLYTHFRSKEELAAAAMIRVMERAVAFVQSPAVLDEPTPLARLKAVVRWTLQVQLAGSMPALPAQNSTLRAYLSSSKSFTQLLIELSELLGASITLAQQRRELDPSLPGEVILFTLYARACDQVLQVLKASGQHADADIIEWVMQSCFDGLGGASVPAARDRRTTRPATKTTVRKTVSRKTSTRPK